MIDTLAEMCAMAGISIHEPLAPRTVMKMIKAKQKMEWEHTSSIIAYVCSYLGGKAIEPEEINPYSETKVIHHATGRRNSRR